jgi:hypothetical protein
MTCERKINKRPDPRSHAVYTGEKSLDPSVIILDIFDFRLRLRTVSEAGKTVYNAAEKQNVFKSGHPVFKGMTRIRQTGKKECASGSGC